MVVKLVHDYGDLKVEICLLANSQLEAENGQNALIGVNIKSDFGDSVYGYMLTPDHIEEM